MERKKGPVLRASSSAWNLLHKTMAENGLEIGRVAFGEGGKPYFADSPIRFSISHAKALCAVAIADRPIGVDIEQKREYFSPRLIERSLCRAEKLVFDGDFTRFWCRKESVAKLTGKGITGYPRGIDTLGR